MSSKSQFAALEVMCLERAALAKKELEYWLEEAEEWRQLKDSPVPSAEMAVARNDGYSES
jgi:hypothetical protein